MTEQVLLWVVFNIFVVAMLVLDLGVFHRHARVIEIREALIWSAFWVALALLFNLGVYVFGGEDMALAFFTSYLIERSLSIDNIFVFLLIFRYFAVPPNYQYRVLFWGIFGALVMRALFIVAGVALIERFQWVIYLFGVFLVVTGLRMALRRGEEIDPAKNPVLRLVHRFVPIEHQYVDERFFVKKQRIVVATPLFLVLLVVETSDVVFALDSIPAILAITLDAFIVYTSNVFAILGLRALYFALAGLADLFHYLSYGLAAILVFVGFKMLFSGWYHMPIALALVAIAAILIVSVVASLLHPRVESQDTSGDDQGRPR